MANAFLDASYAIALSAPNDQYHELAEEIANRLEEQGTRLITTRAVVLEIGNALAKVRYRKAAVELLDSLEDDPNVEIIPMTEQLYQRAFQLYRERPDKEWGLIDCISFMVMWDHGLTDALTTDDHFRQAGFNVLIRK